MSMDASKKAVDVGMAQQLLQLKILNDNDSHRLQASDPCPRLEDAGSCMMAPQPSGSRWNPTADQVTILKELYRAGMRTPTAEQIKHISARLRLYGKIEGKNVFYWFQNHKARERQKRRRCTVIGLQVQRPLADPDCWIAEEEASSPIPIPHFASPLNPTAAWSADLPNKAIKAEHEHIVDHHRSAREMATMRAYGDYCMCRFQGFSEELLGYNYPHHTIDGCERNCEQNLETLQLFPMRCEEDLMKSEEQYCTPGSLYGGLKDGRSQTKDPLDLSLNSWYGN